MPSRCNIRKFERFFKSEREKEWKNVHWDTCLRRFRIKGRIIPHNYLMILFKANLIKNLQRTAQTVVERLDSKVSFTSLDEVVQNVHLLVG
jgi:hypothetical protein